MEISTAQAFSSRGERKRVEKRAVVRLGQKVLEVSSERTGESQDLARPRRGRIGAIGLRDLSRLRRYKKKINGWEGRRGRGGRRRREVQCHHFLCRHNDVPGTPTGE